MTLSINATPINEAPEKRRSGRPKNQTPLRSWMERCWQDSPEELARRLRISPDYLRFVVAGTRLPSVKLARQIKRLSQGQITMDDLLDPAQL